MALTTENQTLRLSGVTQTVVAETAQNPETLKWERFYRFYEAGANAPVLTVYVAGDTPEDVQVTIPEHAF